MRLTIKRLLTAAQALIPEQLLFILKANELTVTELTVLTLVGTLPKRFQNPETVLTLIERKQSLISKVAAASNEQRLTAQQILADQQKLELVLLIEIESFLRSLVHALTARSRTDQLQDRHEKLVLKQPKGHNAQNNGAGVPATHRTAEP